MERKMKELNEGKKHFAVIFEVESDPELLSHESISKQYLIALAASKELNEKSISRLISSNNKSAQSEVKLIRPKFVGDDGLNVTVPGGGSGAVSFLLLLPIIAYVAYYLFQKVDITVSDFNLGESPKEFKKSDKSIKFDDIIGNDEAKKELMEICAYLTDPQKYTEYGATLPKGVLLHGGPGTGKVRYTKKLINFFVKKNVTFLF